METFFETKQLSCLHIYTDKSNWKYLLQELYSGIIANPFFFFLDAERGYHIKVFASEFSKTEILGIEKLVSNLTIGEPSKHLDPLFLDVPPNSVLAVNKINEFIDFTIESNVHAEHLHTLLISLSSAIFEALLKNNFFLEESKRINFAIQLAFLSLVRADLELVIDSLSSGFKTNLDTIPAVDKVLVSFFNDVLKIEEEPMENWVKGWIEASESYLKHSPYHSITEIICQTLEVRSFTNQLLYTTLGVLKEA